MGQSKKKKKGKYRKRRRVAALFLVLFVIGGIVASMTLFFKISDVLVEGTLSRYTPSKIVSVSNIQTGSNLFWFNKSRIEEQIWNTFPYIEQVHIRRVLPGKVIIEVTEVRDLLCFAYGGRYVVFSDTMKVLEVVSAKPENVIEVKGLLPIDPVEGKQIAVENPDQLDFLTRLYAEVKRAELTNVIQAVDVSDKLNYSMILDNRFFVMIGTGHNIGYKIDMLKVTFEQNMHKTDFGYIDLSVAGKATYKPGDYLTDPGKEYTAPPSEEPKDEDAEVLTEET